MHVRCVHVCLRRNASCRMLQLMRQGMVVVHVRQHVPIDVLCCLCIRGIASPLTEGIELHPKGAILCQGHKGPMQAGLLAGCFQCHLVVWNTFNKHTWPDGGPSTTEAKSTSAATSLLGHDQDRPAGYADAG